MKFINQGIWSVLKKGLFTAAAIGTVLSCTACTTQDTTASANAGRERPPVETSEQKAIHESSALEPEPSGNEDGIYAAEPLRFSKEDIDRFLAYCGDSVAQSKEDASSTSIMYSGTCKTGKEFLCIERTGYHPQEVFQYIDQGKYNTYSSYPIYSGEELYETNAQYSVGWMFTEPKEFSFAAADEAESYVRSALSALGVSELTLLRTLYIDHNTMEEAGEKLATDPAYAPIGEPQENNGYPIRDDWSEADDAYMFSFSIPVGSAALSPRFELRETATYIGTQIIVWYSSNGIDFLSVDMPWKVCALEQKPGALISAQAAAEVAQKKIGSILTYQNTTYSDPFLEYQYRQEKNKWILYPVWTVKASYQVNDSPDTFYSYVSVDAFTGQEQ